MGQPVATTDSEASTSSDFGANEWLVEDMYERYLADPDSVDAAWHDFFADYHPAPAPATEPGANGARPQPQVAVPAEPESTPETKPEPETKPTPEPETKPAAQSAAKPEPKPDREAGEPKPAPSPRPTDASRAGQEGRIAREGGRRRGDHDRAAARRGVARRRQHGDLAAGAHGHQRAGGAGQADRRQPGRHQQPPAPRRAAARSASRTSSATPSSGRSRTSRR